jgi:hypothetical protein
LGFDTENPAIGLKNPAVGLKKPAVGLKNPAVGKESAQKGIVNWHSRFFFVFIRSIRAIRGKFFSSLPFVFVRVCSW